MANFSNNTAVSNKEQRGKIETMCLPNETIRAIIDVKNPGTYFLGITNKRIICYDQAQQANSILTQYLLE